MRILARAPIVTVIHCPDHRLVNVTLGGVTLHLDTSDFLTVVNAFSAAKESLAQRQGDADASGDDRSGEIGADIPKGPAIH